MLALAHAAMLWAAAFISTPDAPVAPHPAAAGAQVIKLERYRQALWTVHVTINGKEGDFLFDTGGGVTLLTEQFAKDIDCKYWGRTTGYNMFGKRAEGPHCDFVQIKAGDTELSRVSVGKIDFGDQFAGDKTPDGLLSLDAFDGKIITLDQAAGTLTIETPETVAERTRNQVELPMRVARECSARCLSAFMGVPTPDGMAWLILDSGAGGVSLISKEYAGVFGLDVAGKDQRLEYDIAPNVKVDSPVVVTDMIMDGNLGQPFMSKYVITLDLVGSRLWLSPAGNANSTR